MDRAYSGGAERRKWMLMVFVRRSPDLQASVFAAQTWINLQHRLQPHPPSFCQNYKSLELRTSSGDSRLLCSRKHPK